MIIQKEKCGCYVARYKGREAHSYKFHLAISRLLEEMAFDERVKLRKLEPVNIEDIPF